MSSKKKIIKLKLGRLPRKITYKIERLVYELYGVSTGDLIPEDLRYTCFEDLCIVYAHNPRVPSTLSVTEITEIFGGRWIALYVKGTLAPSIPLVKEIYKRTGLRAAIVVSEEGVKAFLYGNDVLPESVIELVPPSKGLYAVIDYYDKDVVGFAKWNPKKRVYENIYDIGVFIRLLG
ncbi:MAG: hypothetical protein QW159_01530 [Desulfurococcaceae archaeon]